MAVGGGQPDPTKARYVEQRHCLLMSHMTVKDIHMGSWSLGACETCGTAQHVLQQA
jgi:hypothetical protein